MTQCEIRGNGTGDADTQPRTAPTNLTSPAKTGTTISLSWTASTDNVGVTGYDIYNGAALAGSSISTSFAVTNLAPSTSYTFTVKAKDGLTSFSGSFANLSNGKVKAGVASL